jgi:hypothetical protein
MIRWILRRAILYNWFWGRVYQEGIRDCLMDIRYHLDHRGHYDLYQEILDELVKNPLPRERPK